MRTPRVNCAAELDARPPQPDGGLTRVTRGGAQHRARPRLTKDDAIAASLIGTHLIAEATAASSSRCSNRRTARPSGGAAARSTGASRCWPAPPGDHDLVLVSPIILYDHPEIAEQSDGALFDSTEIDEILTLRVMTMTDEEKAQARATDPLAAQIIDRCDAMSPEAMLNLHGVLRDPHAADAPGLIPEVPEGVDWWDPVADNAVRPDIDAVMVNGVRVTRGSRVRLQPSRRADAQDLFFAGQDRPGDLGARDVDGDRTSASCSRTTRPPTCTTGTAGTCTSPPTKSRASSAERSSTWK